jgi:tRNA(fMet)-specific endonuclease VapC
VRLLLDTNRLSDALSGVGTVLDVLEAAETIQVPVVALAELRAGFLNGRRPAENETRLSWFLSQPGISALGVDATVSHHYAELHHVLRRAGRPIPTNDLWIASLALAHSLCLYTRDMHFDHIPGLARC